MQFARRKIGSFGHDREAGAAPRDRVNINPVVQQIGGALDDIKPEAEAVGADVIRSPESLKDVRQCFPGDANAAVADRYAESRSCTTANQINPTATGRIVDGVAYKIAQHA